MSLRDVTRDGVENAIREFDRIGRDKMLDDEFRGGPSTKWYIEHCGRRYDQKVVLRVAHELQELGPLPPGRGTFTANEARRHLQKLGFKVVDCRGPATSIR